jgi:chemotaxis protein methyltransferase CheR
MHKPDLGSEISYAEMMEVVQLVKELHGFDFSGYAKSSLKRRITRLLIKKGFQLFDLKHALLNQKEFLEEFLSEVTVVVTEMFRDPYVFKAIRKHVSPYLASFPFIKAWSAGCATGEEAFSLAILLEEQDLLAKSFIYGTDINPSAISQAKKGEYPIRFLSKYEKNYQDAGGQRSFSDHVDVNGDTMEIKNMLKGHTLFAIHNLEGDAVFNEFQLILCRNVYIYFEMALQEKVLDMFYHSLCPFGFLCIGNKESIKFNESAGRFREVDKEARIYQRID